MMGPLTSFRYFYNFPISFDDRSVTRMECFTNLRASFIVFSFAEIQYYEYIIYQVEWNIQEKAFLIEFYQTIVGTTGNLISSQRINIFAASAD